MAAAAAPRKARALFDYAASGTSDLTLTAGAIIDVLDCETDPEWWLGHVDGAEVRKGGCVFGGGSPRVASILRARPPSLTVLSGSCVLARRATFRCASRRLWGGWLDGHCRTGRVTDAMP